MRVNTIKQSKILEDQLFFMPTEGKPNYKKYAKGFHIGYKFGITSKLRTLVKNIRIQNEGKKLTEKSKAMQVTYKHHVSNKILTDKVISINVDGSIIVDRCECHAVRNFTISGHEVIELVCVE